MAGLLQELRRRNVIRVTIAYVMLGWIIAQVAELALDSFGSPAWVMKTILLLLALGLPLAIFFAWAFEITPDGLKKERDVDRSQSITPRTGRKLDFVIILSLVAALSFVVADNYIMDRSLLDDTPEQTQLVSIAVLPFVNMSNDAEQEYFSDGVSEELLNLLAKIPEFQVTGRTSSFTFKGENRDLREIGQQLGVDNLLEGSVRKSADTVRITAQLVKASDGFHLWSETYDRKLDDIFAVQDEIAGAVVEALQIELLGGTASLTTSRSGIGNGESYNAYLQGLYFYNQSGARSEQSVIYMQQAVDSAPESALAWAGLSRSLTAFAGQSVFDPTDLLVRAREAADMALSLDTNLADAHLAMAGLNYDAYWDWAGAEAAANRALALRPGDLDARMILANLQITFGRLEEAEQTIRAVLEQDPLNTRHPRSLVRVLYYLQRPDEALLTAEPLLEANPDMPFLRAWMAGILATQGRGTEALQYARSEPALHARFTGLAMAQHALGNFDEAAAAQQELEQTYGAQGAAQQAIIFAFWGEFDTAIDWLDIAIDHHDAGITDIKVDRSLAKLRGHPRYEALLRKMNLAD